MEYSEENYLILQAFPAYLNNLMLIMKIHKQRVKMRRRRFVRNLAKKLEINSLKLFKNMEAMLTIAIENIPRRNPKRVWMLNRSKHWWNHIFVNYDNEQMVSDIRMDKETFKYICESLKSELEPHPFKIRESLTVEMKVAIALYKLGSCAEYRVVGNQFGVHKSTVRKCLQAFCNAIIKKLLHKEINMPEGVEAELIISEFEKRSGIPQVLGAIDGTHIPITPKSNGYRDYINRKGWPSLVLQAVVDSNYLFRDITCKHPGCTHDAAVLKDSYLFKRSNNLKLPNKEVNNKNIQAFLVGDPAYPLLPWIMKAYSGALSAEEESFNVYISKARIVVENAFGRLKGRWRILQKRIESDVDFVPNIVATCCVLHNILERRRNPYNPSWDEEVRLSHSTYMQPSSRGQESTLVGEEMREHLKNYISANFPLLKTKN